MQKKWLMRALMAFILADILAGFGWVNQHYVFAAGSLYPRNEPALDLRFEDLSLKDYKSISRKLPDCEITWSVPLSTGKVLSTQSALSLTSLTEEDVALLGAMEALTTVEGSRCTDYDQLSALKQQNPHLEVTYKVPVSGQSFSQDTSSVQLQGLTQEDARNLEYLPALSEVRVSRCNDYALLQQLQKEKPQWNLTYTVALGQEEFPFDAASIRVEGADYEQLWQGLTGLTALEKLELINPYAEAPQLINLRVTNPQVDIQWSVRIGGKTVPQDVKELDISGTIIDDCLALERTLASLPKLETLIMSDCGVDNETMAAFRERQRENYKVIWTVYLSDKAKCRTDDIYFMPIQQGEYYLEDEHTENLKYCEDMICIDVGHHKIHNIDFVSYMPKLQYLVLAHTEVQDVSPLVNCQELIYLEVDWSTIKDYTPIAQLKKLEDLNLNQTYCDLTPIMEMTWLKNLWAPGRGYEWGQKLTEALPDTRVVLVDTSVRGQGWRDLPNYFAMRDILGMHYMR